MDARGLPCPASTPTDAGNLLCFRLGAGRYAVRSTAISAVFECGPLHSVPGAPAAVLGLAVCRGKIVTVVDLHAALALPAGEEPACLLLLAPPLQQTALHVRASLHVEPFDESSPTGIELASERAPGVVERLAIRDGDVWLIDPARIVRRLEGEARGRR